MLVRNLNKLWPENPFSQTALINNSTVVYLHQLALCLFSIFKALSNAYLAETTWNSMQLCCCNAALLINA